MRTRTLYTMGNPEPELQAIRKLIARESGLDTRGLTLYSPTARRDYGRVYYAVCDSNTETGLLFFLSPVSRAECAANGWEQRELLSEYEIDDLFKLARTLGVYRFRMLPALRLYKDEIAAQVALDNTADSQ